jgi:hypothetical protein
VPLFDRWRAERDLDRKSASFVDGLMNEPAPDDVDWLTRVATKGDADHARWELRYARRALGLIAAQRDALDDLTGSAVARELRRALGADPNIDADKLEIAERQFNARLSAYREGLEARGGSPTAVRMGQTLLAFSGGAFRDVDANVVRAGELLGRYLAEANTTLRALFGTASLPEDVPPSALAP